jgi:hypothetical protein
MFLSRDNASVKKVSRYCLARRSKRDQSPRRLSCSGRAPRDERPSEGNFAKTLDNAAWAVSEFDGTKAGLSNGGIRQFPCFLQIFF